MDSYLCVCRKRPVKILDSMANVFEISGLIYGAQVKLPPTSDKNTNKKGILRKDTTQLATSMMIA